MAISLERLASLHNQALKAQRRFEKDAEKLVRKALALKGNLADSFHAFGKVLKELKERRMFLAFGLESFAALCRTKLGFSIDQANRLIAVAEHYSPQLAKKLGRTKSAAILDLMRALDSKQSPLAFYRRGIVVVGQAQSLDIRKAAAKAILDTARRIRAEKPVTGTPTGVHLTSADKRFVGTLVRKLKNAGLERVKIVSLARGKEAGTALRVDVRLTDLAAFAKVAASITK